MLQRILVKAADGGSEEQKPSVYVTATCLKIAERLCKGIGLKDIGADGTGAQFVYHSLAMALADYHQRYAPEEVKEVVSKWTLSVVKNKNLFKQFVKFYDSHVAAGK